ncbi:hypothetical protein MRX96_044738 [Rhipicephalus microplus]
MYAGRSAKVLPSTHWSSAGADELPSTLDFTSSRCSRRAAVTDASHGHHVGKPEEFTGEQESEGPVVHGTHSFLSKVSQAWPSTTRLATRRTLATPC